MGLSTAYDIIRASAAPISIILSLILLLFVNIFNVKIGQGNQFEADFGMLFVKWSSDSSWLTYSDVASVICNKAMDLDLLIGLNKFILDGVIVDKTNCDIIQNFLSSSIASAVLFSIGIFVIFATFLSTFYVNPNRRSNKFSKFYIYLQSLNIFAFIVRFTAVILFCIGFHYFSKMFKAKYGFSYGIVTFALVFITDCVLFWTLRGEKKRLSLQSEVDDLSWNGESYIPYEENVEAFYYSNPSEQELQNARFGGLRPVGEVLQDYSKQTYYSK